jgi:hypothetical protein
MEIVDHIWEARLSSSSAFTGMVMLHTGSNVYWAKCAFRST